MPGETNLHKTLKKEACRWLCRMGYRALPPKCGVPPLGIVDAVGTGVFGPITISWPSLEDLPGLFHRMQSLTRRLPPRSNQRRPTPILPMERKV